ncbi:hypothetical protein THASP1DRAFT_21528 [Thamnocephalis sphaerospora]|uniref:Uncharacterized protein n=1 Tax=Thamnocephalis sphaerospora TaxID=78915 RepID=A0A4P9XWP4_9FUNG|nr:hypothetical protein THASP1DRAFT_21528 [Thamnocephalis sphaerospora]|eukprot:RKP10813.1 hypothetical protein THASP1DRAFT_21528 [Thamnocephalis sphaerospora]
MSNLLFRSYEPRSLGVARIVVVLLLAAGLTFLTVVEILHVLHPAIVFRSEHGARGVNVPALLFIGSLGLFADAQVSLTGTSSAEAGAPALSMQTIVHHANATSAGMSRSLLWIQPESSAVFYPAGASVSRSNAVSDLRLQLNLGGNDTRSDVYVTVLPALQKPPEADLAGLSASFYATLESHALRMDTNHTLRVRESDVIMPNGTLSTDYESVLDSAAAPTTAGRAIVLRLLPAHSTVGNGVTAQFSVERRVGMRVTTWLDLINLLGGAISFAVILYTFMFGAPRLKPWGFVQRYLLRGYMLARLPSGVAWVPVSDSGGIFGGSSGPLDGTGSKWADQAIHRTGSHDSGVGQLRESAPPMSTAPKELAPPASAIDPSPRKLPFSQPLQRRHSYSLSDPDYDRPPPWTGGPPETARDVALLHRIEWLESRWRESRTEHRMLLHAHADRLAELEAFHRRVELFYHRTDLFRTDHSSSSSDQGM